ncbi:MAG TPA: SPFH domain-containing protein [Candidatus Lokiarchaeia archaeon]|nr:SPFH domain-containing protein [Candidatus Lokiarchaeia archaeon]
MSDSENEIYDIPKGIKASDAEKVRSEKLFIAEMPHFLDDISETTTETGMDIESLRQGLTKAYQTLESAVKELQKVLKDKGKKIKMGKGTKFEAIKKDVNMAFNELNNVLVNASDNDEIARNREKVNSIFKDMNSVLSLTGDVSKDTLKFSSIPALKSAFDALSSSLDKQYARKSKSQDADATQDTRSLTNKLLMFRVRLKGRSESVRTSELYWTNPSDMNRQKEYNEVQPRWNWWSKREDRITTEDAAWKEIYSFEKTLPPMQIDAFIVRDYEAALFLKTGQFVGLVPPGLWEIEPAAQATGTEIIWVDTTEFQMKWGIPLAAKGASGSGVVTADFQKVGAFGECMFKIVDPVKFVINLVSEKKSMMQKDLMDFIENTIKNAIKHELGAHKALELVRIQDEFETAVRASLQDTIERWGLELKSLQVLGFKLPEGMEETLQKAGAAAAESDQIDLVETKRVEMDIQRSKLAAIKAQKTGAYRKIAKEAAVDEEMYDAEQDHALDKLKQKQHLETATIDEMGGDEELLQQRMSLQKKKREIDLMNEEANLEKRKVTANEQYLEQDVASRGLDVDLKGAKVSGVKNIASKQYDYDLEMAKMDADKEVELAETEMERDVGVTRGNADSELAREVQDVSLRGMNYGAGMSRTQIYKRLAEIEAEIEDVQNNIAAIDEGEDKQHLSEQGVVQDKRNLNRRMNDLQNEKKALEKSLLG